MRDHGTTCTHMYPHDSIACNCTQQTILFSFRYMVDAADHDKFDASKNELHNLLDKPQLSGIPVRDK